MDGVKGWANCVTFQVPDYYMLRMFLVWVICCFSKIVGRSQNDQKINGTFHRCITLLENFHLQVLLLLLHNMMKSQFDSLSKKQNHMFSWAPKRCFLCVNTHQGWMLRAMMSLVVVGLNPQTKPQLNRGANLQMSNEKNSGCLGYLGDYTTQVCGDYNEPL